MRVNEINEIDADGGSWLYYYTYQQNLLYLLNLRMQKIHKNTYPQVHFLATPDNLYG